MTRCARAAGREVNCCRTSWQASQAVQAAGDRVPFLACILALSVFVYTTPGITLVEHQLKLTLCTLMNNVHGENLFIFYIFYKQNNSC